MSSPIDALTSAAGSNTAASAAQSQIAGNFDTFLKLLTTQLQHQDPMAPMDSNQFTAQLVQFAGVEQSIATNKNLEQLVNFSLANATSAAVGYIGREVTAGGDTANLTTNGAQWNYTLGRNASETDVSIADSAGKIVYQGKGDLTKGEHVFAWDGRTSNGGKAPPGSYKMTIAATDPGGNAIAVDPIIKGIVQSVDIEKGVPMLNVGGSSLKLSDVVSVGPAPVPAADPNGAATPGT